MIPTRLIAFACSLILPLLGAQEPPPNRTRPPRDRPPREGRKPYSLAQACSDRAQLHTIAFDGLAFLTGDFAADTFLPPGKVSDYFGFQYMRDIDAQEGGHNTSFLTRIAFNMLKVLTPAQQARLVALGRAQEADIRRFAELRLPLIQAFRRNLARDFPVGAQGLDRAAVVRHSRDLYALDGRLAFQRAQVMGGILRELDPAQRAALGKLRFGDSRTWPEVAEPLDRRSLPHEVDVAVMTYASEMFAWYAGSLEADTYFCPERHGMYFGGFGMKTAPAMGKQDYRISTALTGDAGEAFLAVLDPTQRQAITDLVDLQRKDLQEIVTTRRATATELRRFLQGPSADEAKVIALSQRYGELDGTLSYLYATAFATVGQRLTATQKAQLKALRTDDPHDPKGPFLYSSPLRDTRIPSSDFLFAPPPAGAKRALLLGQDPPPREGRRGKREEALPPEAARRSELSLILGRPTDTGATLSVRSAVRIEGAVTYGVAGQPPKRTPLRTFEAGVPTEVALEGLPADAAVTYTLSFRTPGASVFREEGSHTFHTCRAPGRTFSFGLQGDSHPERPGKMFSGELYLRTLDTAAREGLDFYVTLGDDFSLERLIERQTLSTATVDAVYARQRAYLGGLGASTPLFLVNGNHEQAARYLLDSTETNAAVLAGRARTTHFPLPAPDRFYTGDAEPVAGVGLLRDYYAWTWGDALFVVIDPYWHSPVPVDNRAGQGPKEDRASEKGEGQGEARRGGKGKRDLWQLTLGEAQYRWLSATLLGSKAKWKFVFAHHVNGTGRGGVEEAGLYEWGGKDRGGHEAFAERRPGWPLPIHGLFVKAGVTVFFQGHDHLYAHQELDGVVYQTTPNPADDTYTAFNREAYRSGDVLPDSGHLRVTVSPTAVRVDYVRSFLPGDEGEGKVHGAVAHSYTIPVRGAK